MSMYSGEDLKGEKKKRLLNLSDMIMSSVSCWDPITHVIFRADT